MMDLFAVPISAVPLLLAVGFLLVVGVWARDIDKIAARLVVASAMFHLLRAFVLPLADLLPFIGMVIDLAVGTIDLAHPSSPETPWGTLGGVFFSIVVANMGGIVRAVAWLLLAAAVWRLARPQSPLTASHTHPARSNPPPGPSPSGT